MPYGVQVQVLPCAPNTGSGNSSGNPQKEPTLRAKLTIHDPRSFHVSGQVQTVFGGLFRETAWKRPSPMNATPHILQSMHRGRPAWIVDIPASFTEKRKNKLFRSRGDAEEYVRKSFKNAREAGLRAAFISAGREQKLLRLGAWLESQRIDPDSIPGLLANRSVPKDGTTILQAVERFLEANGGQGCRPKYLQKLERTLRLFMTNRGELSVGTVSVEAVEEFFGKNVSRPATRKSYRSDLGAFFSWCVRRGYRLDNPILATNTPILDDKAPGILTVSEVRDLLDATQRHSPSLVPWVRHYRERVNPREAQAAGNDPESPSTPVQYPSPALSPSLPILEAWVRRQP